MVDWLHLAYELLPWLLSGYAVYLALRGKAHSDWNADDIAGVLEFLMRKFPDEFQAFLQGREFAPEEWEPLEEEVPEGPEVPA